MGHLFSCVRVSDRGKREVPFNPIHYDSKARRPVPQDGVTESLSVYHQ